MPRSVTPITAQNRREALSLRVAAGQEGFIESVSQCLSEADENPVWHPLGIYDRGTMVGFSMYGFFPMESAPEGRLWLDRLLIDRRFQGRGLGREALACLLKLLEARYPGKKLYLSVVPGNEAAVRLYQSFGFAFNGEKDTHGEDVMVRLPCR